MTATLVPASPERVRPAGPRVITLLSGRIALRVHPRPALVSGLLALAVFALFCLALTTGDFPVPLPDVLRALTGGGDAGTRFIVITLRLPRALLAVVAGAALGVGGSLMQGVTRNPLASPDVIGVQAGAATGALVQIIVFGAGGGAVVAGALIGGVLAVAAVLLSVPLREAGGFRFVLVGIAVAALGNAVNQYLSTRADLTSAIAAAVWQTGSLNGAGPVQVWPVAIALLTLLPVAVWAAAGLRTMALGDDLTRSLGVPVVPVRLTAVAVAVLLTATATAGAGPLLFVALAAGQIAQRLLGRPGPVVVAAGLVGALLTLGSDFAAQRLFGSDELPAGVVTGVLGGLYLAFLLARLWRQR